MVRIREHVAGCPQDVGADDARSSADVAAGGGQSFVYSGDDQLTDKLCQRREDVEDEPVLFENSTLALTCPDPLEP